MMLSFSTLKYQMNHFNFIDYNLFTNKLIAKCEVWVQNSINQDGWSRLGHKMR